MPDDESWRSPDATAYLNRVQRAGFAWEFLRRNPDYRSDYENISRDLANGTMTALEAASALTQRWGLSFRVRSTATKRSRPDLVGIQRTLGSNGAHGGAIRHPKHGALRIIAVTGILRGPRRRSTHSVARSSGRTTDLDSAGCNSDGPCRCDHPVRQTPATTARDDVSPVALPDWDCNGTTRANLDEATASPPDLDVEGA